MNSFRDAAAHYVDCGGEDRYLGKIIAHFGDRDVSSITPMEVRKFADHIYPDAKNVTKNRQVITPVRSVLYHAHELGWRQMARIRPFKSEQPKKREPASRRWMDKFIEQCERDGLTHLSALVLFMNTTAARVSEAVSLLGEDLDFGNKTALLKKTKTTTNSTRHLPSFLVDQIKSLNPGPKDRVFKYTCRYSVNERIRAVCLRANIPYKSSHVIGRHSFATNVLNAGLSVKVAMEAGGWKSSSTFLETYSHTLDAGRTVASHLDLIHHKDRL